MGGNEILLKISGKKRNPECLLASSKPDCDPWKKKTQLFFYLSIELNIIPIGCTLKNAYWILVQPTFLQVCSHYDLNKGRSIISLLILKQYNNISLYCNYLYFSSGEKRTEECNLFISFSKELGFFFLINTKFILFHFWNKIFTWFFKSSIVFSDHY